MHSQRCELRQISKKMSQLIYFFLTRYFLRHTAFDKEKVEFTCLFISCQWSVFPNNSIRICPIKLNIGLPYHTNNVFQSIAF